jgi:hypothetical protein
MGSGVHFIWKPSETCPYNVIRPVVPLACWRRGMKDLRYSSCYGVAQDCRPISVITATGMESGWWMDEENEQ